MKEKVRLPLISISHEDTLKNKTGGWRTQKPIHRRGISPCILNCLSGQDIPCFIGAIREENFEKAYRIIQRTNPFPSLTGRVCPHPCEKECNRKNLDEAISINLLERFIGDFGLKNVPETFPEINQKERIAIIGSGPAGLSCAYYLRKEGWQIIIFEALPIIGGLLAYGIPEFRLPKEILKRELSKKILVPGIEVETIARINKEEFQILLNAFCAIFVAVGASKTKKINLPGQEVFGVINGLDFLENINLGAKTNLGSKVLVVGGGNTAIDAARLAKRLNTEVEILYRRTKEEMPALPEEIKKAEEEGIIIKTLIIPVKVISEDRKFDSLECQKATLGEADESGRRKPLAIEGSNFRIEADTLILATGEETDLSFLPENWKDYGKIFIGGDAARNAGTVAAAIKSGRKNALLIERYLKGEGAAEDTPKEEAIKYTAEELLQQNFTKSPRKNTAKLEARRCFSCGLCLATAESRPGGDNLCEKCLNFCPDVAITKKDGKIEINYDYCKGCGICAKECPTKAIIFKREEEEQK